MSLVDRDNQPLKQAIYEVIGGGTTYNPQIVLFFKDADGVWKSRTSQGEVDVITPHGAIEGVDARYFLRVSETKVREYMATMRQHTDEVRNKIAFLEAFLGGKLILNK